MKEVDFLDAVGRVDEKYIDECFTYKPQKKISGWVKGFSAVAACFIAVVSTVLIVNHMTRPVIIDENGFYIENGVLLRYYGTETDITIPDSVTSIADFSFIENPNVNEITVIRLGSNVKKVETNAFAGLENLTDFIIAANNPEFVTENGLTLSRDGTMLLRYEREGETSFTLPDTVRFVAAHAVQGTELEEIDFGKTVEYIGYSAFADNSKLPAIYLPDSVEYIGDRAFSYCKSAVDGSIPQNVYIEKADPTQLDSGAFYAVPFYNSMLAGQMCPGEEIERGLITPSDAIVKSNLDYLTAQIDYILASLRGERDYVPSEEATFGTAAVTDLPQIPADMTVPLTFSLEDLTYADRGWGMLNHGDVQVFLPAGDYTIVMEAAAYFPYSELFWEDVRFRFHDVYYIKDPASYDEVNVSAGDRWTAIFDKEGDYYTDITFTDENGTIVRYNSSYHSSVPYTLTYSPDGTRVIAEYVHAGNGDNRFVVILLNGDKTNHNGIYFDYMSRYYSDYTVGSLRFVDNDNIEGQNLYGRFTVNVYELLPNLFADHPEMKDPNNHRVKTEVLNAIGYKVTLSLPETWLYKNTWGNEYFYDGVLCGSHKKFIRADIEIEDKYYAHLLYDKEENDWFTNENGVDYLVITKHAYDDPSHITGYNILFRYDGNVICCFSVNAYQYDPADYYDSVILPIIVSASVTAKDEDEPLNVFEWHLDTLKEQIVGYMDTNSYPSYPYTINLSGLSVPVTLNMREYTYLDSISAFGQTITVDDRISFEYSNAEICFFMADDALVFTYDAGGLIYSYIVGDGFAVAVESMGETKIKLYQNQEGELRYMRLHTRIEDINLLGGLCAAMGYDDFLYSEGMANIENGALILGDPEEYCTFGDKYDLDKEFAENRLYRIYNSIEEVFEANRRYPNGQERFSAGISRFLTLTVADLRTTYGKLTLKYSEHGPGQPVYSMEHLPGVLLVFCNYSMDDPLTDDMIPDEIIITEDYAYPVHGLKVKEYMGRNLGIPWNDVEYNEMNGMEATFTARFDNYILQVRSYDTFPAYPEASADEEAVAAWKKLMLEASAGWVREIRVIAIKDSE